MERVTLEVRRAARLSGLARVDPLLFCHLPKCGGTSFADIIKQEYRASQRLFLYKVEELNYPEPSQQFLEHFRRIRARVQVIYGHFKFGMHRFLGVSPWYASILREPVDRVVSLYHHYERDPATSLEWHERIKAGLSLKEFARLARNHMTDLLSGSIDGSVDEAMLIQAKDNIRKYFVAIGTSDNMDEVLRVLSRRFSWRHHDIPILNVRTQPRVEIDEETRAIIADNNRLDTALYEWVRTRGMAEISARARDEVTSVA